MDDMIYENYLLVNMLSLFDHISLPFLKFSGDEIAAFLERSYWRALTSPTTYSC